MKATITKKKPSIITRIPQHTMFSVPLKWVLQKEQCLSIVEVIKFDSHHPISHKKAVVATLLAELIKFVDLYKSEEEKEIISTLQNNCYPLEILERSKLSSKIKIHKKQQL